ncbi:MAG: hypothetical protein UW39_C0007G0029 [Parcubacteria group bacterium GW2011_GWC2_44_17]|nr:MAG: hypothetical protein UW39_C0007G0029 [Parcubacteria group bacterium GW2011_GWC2_44_17]KKT48324.1 MAG: hypothetical protein UW40_C0047G0018 [Parcubacteria group bacterium GW2011_GWF2_44_17]
MEPFGIPKWLTTLFFVMGVLIIVPIVYFILFMIFVASDTKGV